jgi:hypothetical protein
MSILHVANEPPKNMLVAELYTREEWGEKLLPSMKGSLRLDGLSG